MLQYPAFRRAAELRIANPILVAFRVLGELAITTVSIPPPLPSAKGGAVGIHH